MGMWVCSATSRGEAAIARDRKYFGTILPNEEVVKPFVRFWVQFRFGANRNRLCRPVLKTPGYSKVAQLPSYAP